MKTPVYMDCHATTPVDPRVSDAMRPCFESDFGNPASVNHLFGRRAEELVSRARAAVADLIGAHPQEILFTGGATESNNLALKGVVEMYAGTGAHLITEVTEHKSVLETARYLEQKGLAVTFLPVDSNGCVDPDGVGRAITDKTVLISVLFANNEIGTVQPVGEIGKIAKERGIFFHVDAAQAAGKLPVSVNEIGADLLSFSAHKMYGPKGIGALYVRKKNPYVRLTPLLHGGGQEVGLRSGTLNVPGIVGFGRACEIAGEEMAEESERIGALRNRLERGLLDRIPDVCVNGHPVARLPNNLNISFPYVHGGMLLKQINETIAVSTGSACVAGQSASSYVLKAIGLGPEKTETSVRFGLGRFNTEEEVDYVIDRVSTIVNNLREQSPLYQAVKSGRKAQGSDSK